MKDIFSPVQLGDLVLKNRIFLSGTTRTRVIGNNEISPLAGTYYSQRVSAGLLITELINITPGGEVGALQPGIFTEKQVEAWKAVTKTVHEKGGVIFAQIGHSGRVSLPEFNEGKLPIAPSAIPFVGQVFNSVGEMIQPPIPRAIEIEEIPTVIDMFINAAKKAKEAGFDGIELRVANSDLTEQFLHPVSNNRTDLYGGSIQNRSRFLLEILDGLIDVFGKNRTGVKLSPQNRLSEQKDANPIETAEYLSEQFSQRQIAYLNILEAALDTDPFVPVPEGSPLTLDVYRKNFNGLLVSNGAHNSTTAIQIVENGRADAVAFSRLFIANPDLPFRLQYHLPLNPADPSTFYGTGHEGYIDYPFFSQLQAANDTFFNNKWEKFSLQRSADVEADVLINVVVTVKEGFEQKFETAIKDILPVVLKEDGVKSFAAYKVGGEERTYVLFEHYENENALAKHVELQSTKDLLAVLSECLIAHPIQKLKSLSPIAPELDLL